MHISQWCYQSLGALIATGSVGHGQVRPLPQCKSLPPHPDFRGTRSRKTRFRGTPLTPSWIRAQHSNCLTQQEIHLLCTGPSTLLAEGCCAWPLQILLGSMNLQSALFGGAFLQESRKPLLPGLSEKEDFPGLKEAGPRGQGWLRARSTKLTLRLSATETLRPWRILTNPGTSFVEWLRQALCRQL